MEQDQDSSIQEVAPQDQESNVIETSKATEEVLKSTENHESEDKQERNWREARRKQREADVRIKAQEEMIDKLLQANKVQEAPKQEQIPDEFAGMSSDDFATWGQTDKRIRTQAENIAKETFKKLEAEKEKNRFLERLKSDYSDFDQVVNPDSIALLEEKNPKLAASIASQKDPYSMGMQTYHFLKAMNIEGEIPPKRHAKEVERKLEQNEKAVQSPQAYNKRPMAQAFQSSKAEQSKLFDEMMGYAGQAGFGY